MVVDAASWVNGSVADLLTRIREALREHEASKARTQDVLDQLAEFRRWLWWYMWGGR